MSKPRALIVGGSVAAQGAPDALRRLSGQSSFEDAFVTLAGLEPEVRR